MADVTPSGKVATVALARQTAKETIPTAFDGLRLESFSPAPDMVYDEPPAEMGSASLDKAALERIGHNGVTFSVGGRFRPGNNLHLIADLGFDVYSGGFILWAGVNESISVTDDGGGPVTVDIIDGSNAVSGTRYTGDELAGFIKAALDADTTLTQTYTVTYSSTTHKFTIGHGGSTLSLHWTTTPMIADLLGYDYSADDTGSTSYEGDEARVPIGRWQIRDTINDQIYVDEGTPVTVDLLSGTGTVGIAKEPLSAWGLCAVLTSALNGDTSLSNAYYVTYSVATNKFTVHVDTATDFPWTNAACTIADDLGFTADDTSVTTAVADVAMVPACKWIARPLDANFPWYAILAKANTSAWLDLIYYDARINTFTIEGANKSPLTLSASGRAMSWQEAVGTETITADDITNLKAPNTDDPAGHITIDGNDYRMAAVNWEISWEEELEPQCVEGEPYSSNPTERSVGMTCDIYLGAHEGDLYREVFFGGAAGTEPSTTIVTKDVDVFFVAGQTVPGQTTATDRYGFRWEADGAQLVNYPLAFEGGSLDHADLEVNIPPEASSDYSMTFYCAIDDPEHLLAA